MKRNEDQDWDTRYATGKHGAYRDEPSSIVHKFLARIDGKLDPGSKILEIGCGKGHDTFEIQNAGYDILGTDVSKVALGIAGERGVKTQYADMTALPFDDGSFDAVYSVNTLRNYRFEIERVLGQIHRVLRGDGYAGLAFFEKTECKIPDTEKTAECLARTELDRLIQARFKVLNDDESRPGGEDYDVITEQQGIIKPGQRGEHTHYRPFFFLQEIR